MGLFQGIADLGIAGAGYDRTDAAIAEREHLKSTRARTEKLNEMVLQDAIRKDALAKSIRDAAAGVKSRAAAKGIAIAQPSVNDPYQEHVTSEGAVDAPESPNLTGKLEAASRAMVEGGDFDGAAKLRKQAEEIRREGFVHIISGVARGEDPKQIATAFNAKGDKRILGAAKTQDGYLFKYEDGTEQELKTAEAKRIAVGLGLKDQKLQSVAPGHTLFDSATGKAVFTAPERAGTDQLAIIEARKKAELEKIAARAAALRDVPPAMIRNIEALEKRGMSFDEAKAFVGTAKGKPDHELIIDQAGKLKAADALTGKYDKEGGMERLMQDAEKIVSDAKAKAGGKPAAGKTEAPAGTLYRSRDGKTTVTQRAVDSTAKKHGQTVEQVIKELGLTKIQ